MAAFRRIIVFLCGLVFLGAAAFIGACLVNHGFAQLVVDFVDRCLLYNLQLSFIQSQNLWWPILIGCGLLIFGILFLIAALKRKKRVRQVSIDTVQGGSVEVSLGAVDSVVKKAAFSVPGVSNVVTNLQMIKDGLHVDLNLSLPGDAPITAVGVAVREAIQESLETMIGIVPADIRVNISNVTDKSGTQHRSASMATATEAAPAPVLSMVDLPLNSSVEASPEIEYQQETVIEEQPREAGEENE